MKNVTSCCTRIRAGLRSHLPLLLAAVALTGLPMTSQASATATVTGITYKQGSSSIDVVIAIPRRISRSARKNNKNHQLWVTVTYGSVNNTFETVDSGPTPGGHEERVGPAQGLAQRGSCTRWKPCLHVDRGCVADQPQQLHKTGLLGYA